MNLRSLGLPAIILSSAALVACGGSSSSSSSTPRGDLRVIHAASDAPPVNVNANGSPVSGLQGVDFGVGSPRLRLATGTYQVTVDGILPGDATTTVIDAPIDIVRGEITNVLAIGQLGDDSFQPMVFQTPIESISAGEVRVQVAHASRAADIAAASVDVYLLEPGQDPGGMGTTALNFAFGETLGPVTVGAGTYRIAVTAPDDAHTILFDTGEISLPGGSDLLVAAVDNVGAEDSLIRLLVSTGDGNDFTLLDKDATAEVRAVHAAAGVSDADVFADSPTAGLSEALVAEQLVFRASRTVDEVPPADDYTLAVNVFGGPFAGAPISASDISIEAGIYYTVIAAGELGEELFPILAVDDRRNIATEARVRAIHAASVAGTVDVYVAPTGVIVAADFINGNVIVDDYLAVPNFAVGDVTDYLSLDEGNYDVFVVVGGDTVAIEAINVALDKGDIYTLIATNPDVDEGFAEAGFMILVD